MILNEENSNSSSSSSAATTTNTKSPMMSKLKTHNSTPKLAHKSMIYPKAEASSKTVNEAMRMMNGSDTSLKNNSSSICSSISSSSSTSSSSSSSTNSSIYQNHNNHTHNNPDCYIHAPKSSQTLIKYVHPTTTSVVSGGVAVVKQKSLSPANICLSKSSHGRSNGDSNTSATVNPNSVTYRHKSVNVIERTPQIDETTNNPMKLVYNYNANRLSSYDNDVFSNFCSGQNMTDPGVIINDEMMPTMTTNTLAAVNREQEYMNTMSMLPMKQRAASQSISTQTNKSTSGATNVFSRAFNYARQKASPSVNRAGNGTEQGNNKSSSSSTWRSKLTKYLTQSSSPPPPSSSVPPSSSSPSTASSSQHHQRRKRANRRKTIQTSMELNAHRSKLIYHPSSAHNYHHNHYNDFDDEDMDDEPYQDGCDILLDENDDIYSSYHLSRRQTATTNNLITATIKQPHHYNYHHHQQQHNQQQSKLLSISSGLLSLSSSASSTTSSGAANNNNNNHNSVAPTTNALSSASVASSSAASDFIGVVAAANSRQSPQIVDLTSKSTRSPSQNFSKSSKQRINNGFNSLRRILKLNNNNNNPTSNHYHNNNSSNQTLKEPIALNTPPLNHRLAKRTSTLDYSKSMMSTHQPQLQQQQQQQQQSTSKNMFTMTLNRHMSGACGSSASCEEHKSTMVKKKDKLKKQMSFSAVSSSMKVDMIANNRCATSAAVAARSAHSMSLTDDALSHVNNTNQAQNSGNSSRVMNMLRVYKNVLSKISRTPSHCQTPAATSTSTTPASSNTLSLMNCANPRSSHHNHNAGTTPGSKEGQNQPITNSVVSFTSAVNLKPNSSSCLQIQMPIATKQLAAQLNCSGRTNGGGSGGNNTSTNSSSSSSSILFPVMVAPTLPYQQPIQIVSQHHSVENNNKLVSLANSPKTFATIHNPSSAHMMSESSNGTATLYENNTGGYRSVSVHIEATSTRRKNSNTKSPSYDVEEDLACDLEVASFFDKKRRGDVEYGAEEEYDDDDGDVGGAQEEPMMGDNDDYYSTTTYEPPAIINGVGGGGENGMLNYNLDYDDDDFNQTEDDEEHDIDNDDDDDQDEEDSQNLDYLVRQLVAEASLSNLNINMDSRKQQQQQQNQLYENRSSFPDLNRSEFVDDDNLDSSSGENHQQQQRRQVVMDSESELSLVEVEIPSGIMTTATAASQQQQRRRPSSSYSRLESLTSKLNANVTQPSQPAPPIITDSPHSQSGAVKLEKRIRLNYRKQPNLNNINLLNFGTLC